MIKCKLCDRNNEKGISFYLKIDGYLKICPEKKSYTYDICWKCFRSLKQFIKKEYEND